MLIAYRGHRPQVHPSVYVAEGARLIGRVTVGARASIWFNAVLRADLAAIRVGAGSNIQDNAVLHVGHGDPCVVGEGVIVGHLVNLHGCTVGDGALVGNNAIVLDGVRIGEEAFIGAGALVPPGTRVPPRTLMLGAPARAARQLTAADLRDMRYWARHYIQTAAAYKREQEARRAAQHGRHCASDQLHCQTGGRLLC